MLKAIDNFLNKITMYKLVLYYLIALIMIAAVLGWANILPYSPIAIIFSALFITTLCLAANMIFAWAFKAAANTESLYITALILVLIITPIAGAGDTQFIALAAWASVWAIASKFIFAVKKKHIFNPAAFAVALTAVTISQSASWWVGTLWMTPFVLIGGLLLVRKIHRFDMVIGFFIPAIILTLAAHVTGIGDFLPNFWRLLVSTPLFFLAFVMLTEPLTSPPKRWLRVAYGALVGLLFSPSIHLWSIYSTPELALIVGNVFSYFVSPKQKLSLKLVENVQLSPDIHDLVFASDQRLKFEPGQYLEWTLDRPGTDSRGNRRYFTIASSPTEDNVMMGVKFYPDPSTFKQHLLEMKRGDELFASQLSGDFVMPRNKGRKLVFISGGIGVTPFRSMLKYLVDRNEKRDIVHFFSNKRAADIVYEDIFDEAQRRLGIKTIYTITDPKSPDYTGHVDGDMIKAEAPDYLERYFYISGPRAMVLGFKETLNSLGVARSHIKTDYFPGFA